MYNDSNELVSIDMHGRLESKKPTEGEFTVESGGKIGGWAGQMKRAGGPERGRALACALTPPSLPVDREIMKLLEMTGQ